MSIFRLTAKLSHKTNNSLTLHISPDVSKNVVRWCCGLISVSQKICTCTSLLCLLCLHQHILDIRLIYFWRMATEVGDKMCLGVLGIPNSKPHTTQWSNSLIIGIYPATNTLMFPPHKITPISFRIAPMPTGNHMIVSVSVKILVKDTNKFYFTKRKTPQHTQLCGCNRWGAMHTALSWQLKRYTPSIHQPVVSFNGRG